MSPKSKKRSEKKKQKKIAKKKQKDRDRKAAPQKKQPKKETKHKDYIIDYKNPIFLQELGPVIISEIHVPDVLAKKLLENGITHPRPVKGYMIIDTGASMTSLSENAVKQLNLHPTGTSITHGVHGPQEVYNYFVKVVVGERDFAFAKTGNFASLNLRNDMFEHYEKQGLTIIGLLGRDFFVDKTLICDFKNAKVIIRSDE